MHSSHPLLNKGYYQLEHAERKVLNQWIYEKIYFHLQNNSYQSCDELLNHEDTYIRKAAYLHIGKLFFKEQTLQNEIIKMCNEWIHHPEFKVRQSIINAAGEIGIKQYDTVMQLFDIGLFDTHHAPRNAVIGSIKKMAQVNPEPVLQWANQYLMHPDKEIRREICHGIELRGRTHPEDILPLLQKLEMDNTKRVSQTLVHVLGQISYKKDCLSKVMDHLKNWENKNLVKLAILEIIDVHHRYKNFSYLTQDQAIAFIDSQEWVKQL